MKEEKQKPIAVLAGNIREYALFKEGRGSIFRFIEYPDKAMGMEFSDVITIGTFWDRKDAGDFYELAKSRIRND